MGAAAAWRVGGGRACGARGRLRQHQQRVCPLSSWTPPPSATPSPQPQESVAEAWRFTHNRDIVPSVPPVLMGFHHTSREVWLVDVEGLREGATSGGAAGEAGAATAAGAAPAAVAVPGYLAAGGSSVGARFASAARRLRAAGGGGADAGRHSLHEAASAAAGPLEAARAVGAPRAREPDARIIVCDESGEDPTCHNSACTLGLCTSIADHLLYMDAHMWAGDEC